MQPPKFPKDEACRLNTLKSLEILDTKPEERFDRVTRMAKRLFQVDIALVSLVDEHRQWFKSAAGLDATETSRDISFCGHAILDDEIFYIADASQDLRFADNPLVVEAPRIRFYAGRPLRAPNGSKLGTLCIIDSQPKTLTEDDFAALQDLAVLIEQEIAVRQQATMDDLTDISNRRGFKQLAEKALSMSRRQFQSCALAYFDLDNFKPINDKFGHCEGDKALILFADQIKRTFRASDIFGRLGGDEFAVLFTNTTSESAHVMLKRFNFELKEAIEQAGLDYDIAFTWGIIKYDEKAHPSIEELICAADKVMYQNKAGKKVG